MSLKSSVGIAVLTAVVGVSASIASAQITIPTVQIGSPGNAADPTTGYGAVAYTYNMGATEVTNAQYVAFLNAKAASDPYALYNPSMAHPTLGGITRTGSAGTYSYAAVAGRENKPVNLVSFLDATRFANWLHNGQGDGDTETGAYTLTADGISANTITRNAGALWAITSEDEWYKAAYYQPASQGGDSDDYWEFATGSSTISMSQANYFGNGINNTTPVGSYAANSYGAFDLGGNVWEWNEAIIDANRGRRGGSYVNNSSFLQSNSRSSWGLASELYDTGFRVVQIPTPSSVALLAIGGLVATRRRRGGR